MDMYRDTILDHYKHPRNFGTLNKPNKKAESYNATCGDRITMEIKFKNSASPAGRQHSKVKSIGDIRFSGQGCAISQASASMLTEKVSGMTEKEIMKLTTHDILDMLGTKLTPSRTKCGVLPLEVLQKAISYG